MASTNVTEHYGLSQWVPGDSFIRTDFNEDNRRLDRAVRAAEEKAERALDGLVPVSYNVFQLILQSYYDKKQTGFKKALVFDGFLDGAMIASLTGGLTRVEGSLTLQGSGMGDLYLGYGSGLGNGVALSTRACAATGSATLNGFTCRVTSAMLVSATYRIEYAVMVNGTVVSTGTHDAGRIAPDETQEVFFYFLIEPVVKKGDTFSVKLETPGSGYLLSKATDGTLGGTFQISSATGQEGKMTGRAVNLPASRSMLGWVRHKNGSVALSVKGPNGAVRALAPDGQRTVTELGGQSCTETAFRLDGPTAEGKISFLLDAALGGSAAMSVYDFGVILL